MRRRERGGSGLEFALASVVWAPLLVGTLAIGSSMIRGLQTTQVARDAAHMYARGVDYSLAGSQAMLGNLAGELGTLTSSGNGVVIFSTLTYVGRYMCKQGGYANTSTPPNPTAACQNYRHFVFTHRWVVGNTARRASNFGAPTAGVNATNGFILFDDYLTKTGTRADAFTLLPAPLEDGNDGFQAGQSAYLVEVFFQGPVFAGFTQGGTYAFGLF